MAGRLVGAGGVLGGPGGGGGTVGGPEGVRRAPAPDASRGGRGGNPGRAGAPGRAPARGPAAAPGRCGSAPGRPDPEPGRASGRGGMRVPPEAPRGAEGVDVEPVRPSPSAGPAGTGRIRKVVSDGLSAGASARRGGTGGWAPGRGGTAPGTDGEPCAGTPGVFGSGAGGVSGKRAEAGGGGGVLAFRGPVRASVSEGAGDRPVPVRGFAGALTVGRGGVAPEPASSVIGIGGRPVAPVARDRSPPPVSPGVRRPDVSGPPDIRAPLSSGPCQSNPPNVARFCAPGPRRLRSPNACQSVSSLIRPPGSTASRRPDSSEPGPSSPAAGGWAGLGGVVGRGGTEARRASVLMHPPFPHVRAVRSCAGPRRSRRPRRRPSGHAYPHGRAGIPARRRRGANSPACVRVTLRVVPGRTGTSPPGRGHLPGTSPYPAVILSGSLRP